MARGQINKMDEKGIKCKMKGVDECRFERDYFRRETKSKHALKGYGQMMDIIPVNLQL
jgi:hypothetical protein